MLPNGFGELRPPGGMFTKSENDMLRSAIIEYCTSKNIETTDLAVTGKCRGAWTEISKRLPDRTRQSVYRRGLRLILPCTRGSWSEDEAQALLRLVEQHGRKWAVIQNKLGRTAESCFDKYRELLKTNNKWSDDETKLFMNLIRKALGIEDPNVGFAEMVSKVKREGIVIPFSAISRQMGDTNRTRLACYRYWQKLSKGYDSGGSPTGATKSKAMEKEPVNSPPDSRKNGRYQTKGKPSQNEKIGKENVEDAEGDGSGQAEHTKISPGAAPASTTEEAGEEESSSSSVTVPPMNREALTEKQLRKLAKKEAKAKTAKTREKANVKDSKKQAKKEKRESPKRKRNEEDDSTSLEGTFADSKPPTPKQPRKLEKRRYHAKSREGTKQNKSKAQKRPEGKTQSLEQNCDGEPSGDLVNMRHPSEGRVMSKTNKAEVSILDKTFYELELQPVLTGDTSGLGAEAGTSASAKVARRQALKVKGAGELDKEAKRKSRKAKKKGRAR